MSGTIEGKMRNLIPQPVIAAFSRGQRHGRFSAAALFVDMTGFTPLTETLFRRRRRGAEALSETLTAVFQPMVRQVYARDGFITHFAGDAFTAVFPCRHSPEDAARRAWQTAVCIQQYLSGAAGGRIFATPYGEFTIGVTIGLALGEVSWRIPGADGRYTYYFRGDAIRQCAQAQKGIQSGEIAATDAFRQALGEEVTAVSRLRPSAGLLAVPDTAAPPAGPRPIPPVSRSDLRPFIPDAVLDLTLPADFRHVCPVFISLQGEPLPTAVDPFLGRLLALTDAYGGAFSRVEFSDKGGFIALWFGAPVAHEDNVARAAQCLLALRREAAAQEIVWRAGLTYGLTWAGFRGADARWEYTLFGDAVNTAAHIAMRAGWGEIWLSQAAARECRAAFHVRSLGPVRLKGKPRASTLYQLIAGKTGTGLLYRSTLVGRQAELARLQEAAAPIFQGQFGGLTAVYGEAGMGKSRLLHELKQQLAGRVDFLTAPVDAILRPSLNPFRTLLRRLFNQSAGQSAADNRAQFQAALDDLLTDLAGLDDARAPALLAELRRARPFLADLVGLPVSDAAWGQMEPRLRAENRALALIAFFQARALRRPLALHLEDAHWLDEDSRRLLPRLLPALSGYPAVILITARLREDGSPPLPVAGAAPQTAVTLTALTAGDIARLARQLIGAPLSPETSLFLAERSGGNPFFAEQIILDLQERAQLVLGDGAYTLAQTAAPELPRTLNTLLIARLDRLPPPVKQAVQTAAVLGLVFARPVLAQMLPGGQAAAQAAAVRGRIWEKEADGRYRFSHALLQEAAYEMQPRAHLREMHVRAAQALAAVYAADLAPWHGEIAYHYEAAFNLGLTTARGQARRALQTAGETAAARYETETAVSRFSRALDLTDETDTAARFAILQAREKVYEWLGDRQAQAADLTAMQFLAARLSWREMAVAAMRRAAYESFSVSYERALSYARQAVTLAEAHEDGRLAAQTRRQLGHILYRRRRYREAGEQFRQAIALAQTDGDTALLTRCLNGLGMTLDEEGHYAEARRYYRQALTLQRESGDLAGETVTLNNLGWADFVTGHTVDARRHYAQALAISRRIGHRVGES
ncbi:MAG TPA: tetratricopeptide repeat protein, partial [Anaerolineae bacterium]|nr:tetratricopeptide repeat protein [Anaerolineae bacterium]